MLEENVRPPVPETAEQEMLQLVWRRKVLVVMTTVVATLAGALGGSLLPRTYAARTTLALTGDSDFVSAGEEIVGGYRTVGVVFEELQLAAAPWFMTVPAFLEKNLSVVNPPDTATFVIRVEFPDAKLAATIANRIAAVAISRTNEFVEEYVSVRQARFGPLHETAFDQWQQAKERRLAKSVEYQVGYFEAEVNSLLEEKARLVDRRARILGQQRKLESIASSLDTASPENRGQLTLGVEAATGDSDASMHVTASSSALGDLLKWERTRAVGELEYLTGVMDHLESRGLMEPTLPALVELYRRQDELAALEVHAQIAEETYSWLAVRFERMTADAKMSGPFLQLIDEAVVDPRPVFPRPFRIGAAAGVLGFLLVMAGLYFSVALRPQSG